MAHRRHAHQPPEDKMSATSPTSSGYVEGKFASDRVFNTTELVEAIFTHLPMCDIIRARRTCKHWDQIIQTSPSVQELLFLKPITDSPVHFNRDTKAWTLDATAPKRVQSRLLSRTVAESHAAPSANIPLLHPLLSSYSSREYARSILTREGQKKAFLEQFITQPPVAEVVVSKRYFGTPWGGFSGLDGRKIVRAKGIGVTWHDVSELHLRAIGSAVSIPSESPSSTIPAIVANK